MELEMVPEENKPVEMKSTSQNNKKVGRRKSSINGTANFQSATDIRMEGYLMKKRGLVGTWATRWFIVMGSGELLSCKLRSGNKGSGTSLREFKVILRLTTDTVVEEMSNSTFRVILRRKTNVSMKNIARRRRTTLKTRANIRQLSVSDDGASNASASSIGLMSDFEQDKHRSLGESMSEFDPADDKTQTALYKNVHTKGGRFSTVSRPSVEDGSFLETCVDLKANSAEDVKNWVQAIRVVISSLPETGQNTVKPLQLGEDGTLRIWRGPKNNITNSVEMLASEFVASSYAKVVMRSNMGRTAQSGELVMTNYRLIFTAYNQARAWDLKRAQSVEQRKLAIQALTPGGNSKQPSGELRDSSFGERESDGSQASPSFDAKSFVVNLDEMHLPYFKTMSMPIFSIEKIALDRDAGNGGRPFLTINCKDTRIVRFTFETTLKHVNELKEELESNVLMAMEDVKRMAFCCHAGPALLNALAIRKLEEKEAAIRQSLSPSCGGEDSKENGEGKLKESKEQEQIEGNSSAKISKAPMLRNTTDDCSPTSKVDLISAKVDAPPLPPKVKNMKEKAINASPLLSDRKSVIEDDNNNPYEFSLADVRDSIEDGWNIFDCRKEYARVGLLNENEDDPTPCGWRLVDNSDFKDFSTYPAYFIVPANFSEEDLLAVAKFRSRERIPAVTWKHVGNQCVLVRSSQPRTGAFGKRCEQDERLLDIYRESNLLTSLTHGREASMEWFSQHNTLGFVGPDPIEGKKFHIFDARAWVAAKANEAKGKGVETKANYKHIQIHFCDIGNIHTMRESHTKFSEAVASSGDLEFGNADFNSTAQGSTEWTLPENDWNSRVEASGWLKHAQLVLRASLKVAETIHLGGESCLVHCSDGWDRTAQISALPQLMLDPFFRTLRGFCVLVEKEWVAFGYKFHDRCGHRPLGQRPSTQEKSPIFLQFLEVVAHILRQYPCAFEFNERLLVFLADHMFSGLFGTFMYNTECQRRHDPDTELVKEAMSIWTFILESKGMFANPCYDPNKFTSCIWPSCNSKKMRVWEAYWLRWDPETHPRDEVPGYEWTGDWTYDGAPSWL